MVRVDSEIISPMYVYTYLRTIWHIGYMEYIQNQTTGIKNLLLDEFLDLMIPIIKDSTKQDEISKNYISTLETAKHEIDKQYDSISKNRKITIDLFLK